MRFFGFGKKRALASPEQSVTPAIQAESAAAVAAAKEIVVYGTNDGSRCRQVRALLAKRAYAYRDVRVDEDLSTRSWLQRTTGDDALPKVFIGAKCYGGFEDIQVLVFDGRLDRILRGGADEDGKEDDLASLKEDMDVSAIITLLRKGEILTIKEGDMEMDAWAEPLANPPLVYYEGVPHPIAELEDIVEQLVARLRAGEVAVSWKGDA
jgi:glutaredoxin